MNRVGGKGDQVVAFSDRNQPWGEVEEPPSGSSSLWSTLKCSPSLLTGINSKPNRVGLCSQEGKCLCPLRIWCRFDWVQYKSPSKCWENWELACKIACLHPNLQTWVHMPKAAFHTFVFTPSHSQAEISFDEHPSYQLAAAFVSFSVTVLSIGYHEHTARAAVAYWGYLGLVFSFLFPLQPHLRQSGHICVILWYYSLILKVFIM